jgi:hypothetical protein
LKKCKQLSKTKAHSDAIHSISVVGRKKEYIVTVSRKNMKIWEYERGLNVLTVLEIPSNDFSLFVKEINFGLNDVIFWNTTSRLFVYDIHSLQPILKIN